MKFRIAEIFGPTIQGEGRRAGQPCHFVRFGGCDYRCSWCDSPHAVLPHLVAQLPQMDESEIIKAVRELPRGPKWVVLSGGNPALFDLSLLLAYLQDRGYLVMAETQGTEARDWLKSCDEICVSPKPPSAGNVTTVEKLREFLDKVDMPDDLYLKVVVFDADDYQYAREIHAAFPYYPFFISIGTGAWYQPTVGSPDHWVHTADYIKREEISRNFAEIAAKVAHDPFMRDVRVFPQLHVIAWGTERGH